MFRAFGELKKIGIICVFRFTTFHKFTVVYENVFNGGFF